MNKMSAFRSRLNEAARSCFLNAHMKISELLFGALVYVVRHLGGTIECELWPIIYVHSNIFWFYFCVLKKLI